MSLHSTRVMIIMRAAAKACYARMISIYIVFTNSINQYLSKRRKNSMVVVESDRSMKIGSFRG